MSRANKSFVSSIADAKALLDLFDKIHKDSADTSEVLKRAGLVMALTAWETYVEDRVLEAIEFRLKALNGSPISKFVKNKLTEELKRFHNPTTEKTKKLFIDYLEIDVTTSWKLPNHTPDQAKKTLDDLIAKRGDAVHRSKSINNGSTAPHLVSRPELEKAIRFLNCLVEATDKALEDY